MKTVKHTAIIMTFVASAFLLFTPAAVNASNAETANIIPKPVSIEHRNGFFVFKPSTRVVAEKEAHAEASKLIDALAPPMGYKLKLVSKARPKANAVRLTLDKQLSKLGDEGYILDISTRQILIRAKQPAGLFYGIQTLLQLLPSPIFSKALVKGPDWKVPCLKITDYPRFQWRGLLIDPARHFIPINDVKKFLRVMGMILIALVTHEP